MKLKMSHLIVSIFHSQMTEAVNIDNVVMLSSR
jgi:hypothetical protein